MTISKNMNADQKMKLRKPRKVAINAGMTMFHANDEDMMPPVPAGRTEKCQTNAAMTG